MDLICQSKSGTGKTLTFCSIILERISLSNSGLSKQDLTPQAIIITPTREIAVQIRDFMRRIGRHYRHLTCDTFIGGVPLSLDRKTLNLGCQVIIGTPGRVLQLININSLITFNVKMVVFDEADQLFSADSFKLDVRSLLNKTPRHKQVMAFSAAYNEQRDILKEIASFMRSPEMILISNDRPSLKGVQQYFYYIDAVSKSEERKEDKSNVNEMALDRLRADHRVLSLKVEALVYVLSSVPFNQCIVFLNNKGRARDIVAALNENGFPSYNIGGDQPQKERLLAISKLREFKIRILVSSDLTSRGIDCDRVNLVINLDLPFDAETYLHRVGRTGRFGTYGLAITFVSRQRKEMGLMQHFIETLNSTITELPKELKQIANRKYLSNSMVLKTEEEKCRIEEFERNRERAKEESKKRGTESGKLREPSSVVESEYIQKERERILWEEAAKKKEESRGRGNREEKEEQKEKKKKRERELEHVAEFEDTDDGDGDGDAEPLLHRHDDADTQNMNGNGYCAPNGQHLHGVHQQQEYYPQSNQPNWSHAPYQSYHYPAQPLQTAEFYNDLNRQALKAAKCFHAMFG